MNKYQEALDFLLNISKEQYRYFTYDKSNELLQELVEKATTKKVQYSYFNYELANYHCPNCGEAQGLKVNKRWRKFCPHCGQALNWSEEDEA